VVRFTSFVEIALGADLTGAPATWSWTDISDYVHQPAGIAITRGRNDRYSQTPPATCALTLINNGGRFVPRNPTGAFYGSIRKNTPLRVLLRPNTNSLSDTFNRSASSSWGSADVGGAWTNTGGAASDFSVAAASGGRHLHTSAASAHYSTLSISVIRYDVRVRVKTAALATGAALTAGIAVRYVDASNTDRYEIQLNTDQTVTGRLVQRDGGSDTVYTSETISGVTHAADTWYWIRAQSGNTAARLKVWQDGNDEPTTWNIDGSDGILPNPTAGAIGLYSIRETSNTNANATIDFDSFEMVDGPRIQFTGYVDEWPTTWADASGNQSFAPITCSGLLRRIQQGEVFRSALFRAHTDGYYSQGAAVAYWPCEDGSGATSIASGIGGTAMQVSGDTNFASDSTIAGSEPLPVVADDTSWVGVVPTHTTATSWAVRWVMKIPSAPASTQTLLRWTTAGSLYIWQLNLVPGGADALQIEAYNTALVEQLGAAAVPFDDADFYDRQLYFEVNATQTGSAIDWDYNYWFGTSGAGNTGSEASATIGNVQSVRFGAGNGAADLGGATLGHIAVATNVLYGASSDGSTGFSGERTDSRLFRLAAEENLSSVFGELLNQVTSDQLMGPQPTASLISQLREVEATEEGILHDGKQGQLTILARALRYNRAVEIALTVASGQLGWPFEAVDDDRSLRNDVTVSRPGGSSARATQTTGTLSVTNVGVYSDSVTVNTETDAELPFHAQWRRHLGVVEELRYPSITLNLTRHQDLIEEWCDADIGSRIQITGPPSELPPDVLDLHIEGYTEAFDSTSWVATLNTSPTAPWQVFTLEDSSLGRLDTAGSSLVAAATAGATSLLVATASGPPWSTTAEPYDWEIAGERITVTTMTTATPAFIAAGTVAHGNNASVVPGLPAGMTADVGQVIIGMAAIRNSGTGTPNLPTGYTGFASSGNLLIFGKYYVTGDAAPTVSFTSGVANADTSARLFGFSGLSLELDDATSTMPSPQSQLNSSAANIAFPSLVIDRAGCVALLFAWKQDDWTSVATPSSMDAEMADNATTTGDDQGIAAYYDIQTTATSIVAGSLSVTGGAAAISRAIVLALRPLQTATVTRAVNGVSKAQSAGAAVQLWRPGVGGLAL
jgi:hypothetical protein